MDSASASAIDWFVFVFCFFFWGGGKFLQSCIDHRLAQDKIVICSKQEAAEVNV